MSTFMDDIRRRLSEIYLPEGVEIWLTSRNRQLDNQRPIDLIASGRADEVREVVNYLTGGGW